MAISQALRSKIHQGLSPMIGEEASEAMLGEFPAREADEPATRDFVRLQASELRAEIARLDARISDRLRDQTRWIAGAMAVGMGLAAGIARIGG
jgi:hypothetical protein